MDLTIKKSGLIKQNFSFPGDKSIAHRAIILGSITDGKSIIRNLPDSEDITATIKCMEDLGVRMKTDKNKRLYINGCGFKGLRQPIGSLNIVNSGTTMRLLAGLLSAQPFLSVLTGGKQLRKRPMKRVVEPLRRMGAIISGEGNSNFAPLTIKGNNLRAISYTIPVASAQVKSALLIAGLFARDITKLTELIPTRDHTERMLKSMGVTIKRVSKLIKLKPPLRLNPIDIKLPGDISSAAYFIAAAIMVPHSRIIISDIGLNPTRTGFIRILKTMGAKIKVKQYRIINGEAVGTIKVSYSNLRATKISGRIIPTMIDELPILAVVATQANGTTIIKNAEELRVKESDRISAIVTELKRLKADIRETTNGLIIKGPTPLKGAVCDSYNDHRIAMSLTIAGLIAEGKTTIKNAGCVNKSFPLFYRIMAKKNLS